ncbi:hypothetical protein VNO77_26721 [Canavalia gladiata]|uniref:Uncharacterized protein n=1 Tax=Canavalia gladiata TaxID=3824 RepID=A0AAN9Q5U0_CANGL
MAIPNTSSYLSLKVIKINTILLTFMRGTNNSILYSQNQHNLSNFYAWNKQLHLVLSANKLLSYINGETKALSPTVDLETKTTTNHDFSHWECQDNYVFLALLDLSKHKAQAIMLYASTVVAAYSSLSTTYASMSWHHIMSLKECLASISKGDFSSFDYLMTFHSHVDDLALNGRLDDLDLVIATLNDLRPTFPHSTPIATNLDVRKSHWGCGKRPTITSIPPTTSILGAVLTSNKLCNP